MTVRSFQRGWPVHKDKKKGWVYSDDLSSADIERSCKLCGLDPTSKGYDACLGYVRGCKSVCCGHGEEAPYFIQKRK